MGGVRDCVRAYRDALGPATDLGVHARPHNLALRVAKRAYPSFLRHAALAARAERRS